jgi:hypothetical protein
MKKAMFAIVTMAATVFACGCPCGIPKIPCCWAGNLIDLLGLLGTITLPA